MPISEAFNMDCMEAMKTMKDKQFHLAIVDPPYGIGINNNMGRRKGDKHSGHKKIKWDNSIPPPLYFKELMRVSKNQIIWGGNYFPLPLVGSWLFWDKLIPEELSFSMGELAWMSFGNTLRKIELRHNGFQTTEAKKIHPTQKPVQLYRIVIEKYCNYGDTILDTHLGSGSSRIAAYDLGFDFTGYELDKDYFEASEKRFHQFKSQLKLL